VAAAEDPNLNVPASGEFRSSYVFFFQLLCFALLPWVCFPLVPLLPPCRINAMLSSWALGSLLVGPVESCRSRETGSLICARQRLTMPTEPIYVFRHLYAGRPNAHICGHWALLWYTFLCSGPEQCRITQSTDSCPSSASKSKQKLCSLHNTFFLSDCRGGLIWAGHTGLAEGFEEAPPLSYACCPSHVNNFFQKIKNM
jgi:hypothetical protein